MCVLPTASFWRPARGHGSRDRPFERELLSCELLHQRVCPRRINCPLLITRCGAISSASRCKGLRRGSCPSLNRRTRAHMSLRIRLRAGVGSSRKDCGSLWRLGDHHARFIPPRLHELVVLLVEPREVFQTFRCGLVAAAAEEPRLCSPSPRPSRASVVISFGTRPIIRQSRDSPARCRSAHLTGGGRGGTMRNMEMRWSCSPVVAKSARICIADVETTVFRPETAW